MTPYFKQERHCGCQRGLDLIGMDMMMVMAAAVELVEPTA